MKILEKILLLVTVFGATIIILDATAAHAGGQWALDLLWFLRR